MNFSSHGTRVDLQGWGNNITTTGGNGNLQGGTAAANVLRRYARTFGGTSGAGPIVTNAVVAVQSYLKATGQGVYTAAQMTELLRRTGTSQTGTRLVGPLPGRRRRAALGRGRRAFDHGVILGQGRQRVVPEPDDHARAPRTAGVSVSLDESTAWTGHLDRLFGVRSRS